MSEKERLDSWKEIANYLHRDLRTVKRWEKEKGLPIHRLPGGRRHPVFAYKDEIDAWFSSGGDKSVFAEVHAVKPEAVAGPVTPAPLSRKWRRAALILGPAVFLLLGLGAIVAFRFRPTPQLRVSGYLALTNDGRDKGSLTLLTDGARVYFEEGGADGESLAAVSVAGGGTEIVSMPVHDTHFYDLSPQGSEFLVGRSPSEQGDGELWIVPLGKSPRRIANLRGSFANWSPDGRQLAFTLHEEVFVANADGSAGRKIATVSGQTRGVRWSPNGKVLRFTANDYHNGLLSQSMWEVGADGSNLHRLLDGWNDPPEECCGSWTPDGRFFVFQATRDGRTELWALAEKQGLFAGNPGPPQRLFSGPQDYSLPFPSRDGNRIFTVGFHKRGELVRYDSRLREFVPFLGGISATWASFAKSGKSVAYIAYPDLTVWRANADGSGRTQITFSPLQVEGFSWSPDETRLALRARVPGKPWLIYLVPSQGGEAHLLMPQETEQGIPTWSADGSKIAFGDVPKVFGEPSGTEVIHILDLSTHTLSELRGSKGMWTARWSPDGSSLAALTIVGQQLMLYNFKTRKWRPTQAKNVNNPNWSADNRYIYFDTEGADRMLCRVQVADGHVEQLVNLRNYPRLAWGWSGVAPDNSPLILRNLGPTEIYSLTLDLR